jgi:outer membrane receptor protein involved in Fe transport
MVLPDVAFTMLDGFRIGEDPNAFNQIRSRDQQNANDRSIGLSFQYNLSDNWRIKSITRYADKALVINHIAEEGGMSTIDPTGLFARVFANFDLFFTDLAPMTYGKFEFYDLQTDETLALIDTESLIRGKPPEFIENNLPGTGEVFWSLVDNDKLEIKEFVQQLTLNGSLAKHNVTLGGYYSLAQNFRTLNAATTFLTAESRPRLLGTRVAMPDFATISRFVPELLPLADLSNQTAIFNDASGLHGYNSQVNEYNELDERVISFFLSDEWEVSDRVNVDVGLRYETINHNGRSGITEVFDQNEGGGIDGNRLTVSDNIFQAFGGNYHNFNINYSGLSYSGGINYKVNNNTAIYGRYSHSEKLLDAIYEQANFIDDKPPTFLPREVSQAEIGVKYSADKFGIFAVAYHSQENNIFNQVLVVSLSTQDGFYLTPPVFNSVEYLGAEIEFNYAPTSWWTMRNILNISGGTNKEFKVWNFGPTDGIDDDVLIDLSGEPVAGSTTNKFDLSPVDITSNFYFNKKKGAFLINYRRFAERFANNQQAFTLPSFDIWKVGVSYNFSNQISASANINNVFNEVGILRFVGTNDVAGFIDTVTKDFIVQNPDKWFNVQNSLARAFYFSITYSLR